MSKQHVIYTQRSKVCSFKGNTELWSKFKEECKFRGVSICHVLEALMEAWILGQKAEATLVRPVTVNLTMEHVVQRPRRMIDAWQPKSLLWPPCCEHADKFIKSTREVGCLDSKEFISLRECWACFRRRSMV